VPKQTAKKLVKDPASAQAKGPASAQAKGHASAPAKGLAAAQLGMPRPAAEPVGRVMHCSNMTCVASRPPSHVILT
jgi:hypothetical protein